MSVTPSRQALRHFSQLCHASKSMSYSRCVSSRVICRQQRHQPPQEQTSNSYLRTASPAKISKFHLSQTAKQSSSLSSATQSKSQSQSQSLLQDEQDQEAASLPDITNYYTLFPSTLPDGPPSSLSSLSSSSSTTTTTPQKNTTPTPIPFAIPLPALRKEFLSLQSKFHPDKYDPSTQAHQKALALSSLINTAYKTLADPLLRAQYLLQLCYDIDVTNEDNAAHPTDQETLMEVMGAQERIEVSRSQDEVDTLKDENSDRIKETIGRMSLAFEIGDVVAAKNECVRLKYWHSLQQGLIEWESGKEIRLVH